jgi:MoxR-like ATPase
MTSGMDAAGAIRLATDLIGNIGRVIRGNGRAVETAATALFAGGHVLIEDVPGVGKTMTGRAIARSIDGSFKRIQGTPDLLPADITGSAVYNQATHDFEFIPGPLFANVVLVDEINRTTPRTQSALLEAMDENAVTVEGARHPLPEPLFVVATQNPLEHHGTYPLPEGQLDRFAIATDMGYVDAATERDIIVSQLESHPIGELEAVLNSQDVLGIRRLVRSVHVSEAVLDYALGITRATRDHRDLELGASQRASVNLIRCAQARALMQGREYVVPDDVKTLAVATLAHRVVPVAQRRLERSAAVEVMREIIGRTPAPVPTAP